MTCFYIELISNKKFDINRPTIIRYRTPYTLSISPHDSCANELISLYDLAQSNDRIIGGIILTEPQASMICNSIQSTSSIALNIDAEFNKFLYQRYTYILCDKLEAKHISIEYSACGITQGDYLSLFLKQSALIDSTINSELVFCKDAAIDQSTLNIDYSFNIISESITSIVESNIKCNSFFMLQPTPDIPSAKIRSGTITVENYSNLNYVNASGTNFDLGILSATDCIFDTCSLSLSSIEPDISLEPSVYTQPMVSGGTDILTDHFIHIGSLSTYQQNECEEYAYDDDGFLEGCSDDMIVTNSPMQEEIISTFESLGDILNGSRGLTESLENSMINIDSYKTVLSWVSGQPLKFADSEPVNIGQIFTRCAFKDNTIINTDNTLIINNCSFFKCNNIDVDTILARNVAQFTLAPTPIEKFSSTETSGISSETINAYIDKPSFDLSFEPGFTTLDTDCHVTTRKWYGEVSIGSNCSITCTDFYSAYCNIQPYGLLKLNSNEITFKNLGIQCLPLDATIEMITDSSTLYITRNYDHQIPKELRSCNDNYGLLLPDLRGTISGTSISIRQPNAWEDMSSFFNAATIACKSLNINIPPNRMEFYKILDVTELEITRGNVLISNLGEDISGQYMEGTIKIIGCALKINNLVFPQEVTKEEDYYTISLESYESSLSISSFRGVRGGRYGVSLMGAVFNNSRLIDGALVSPSISGFVNNLGTIVSPSVDKMRSYSGGPGSYLTAAIIPSWVELSFEDNPEKDPPAIRNCIIRGVPDARRIGTSAKNGRLLIDNSFNGESDITNISAPKIMVNAGYNSFSYGNIGIISSRGGALPDYGWKTDWNIALIKANFISNIPKDGPPLQLSGPLPSDKDPRTHPMTYVRDIVIQNSRVDLVVGNNHFINFTLENSKLDGKDGAFSNCSFIFNISHSFVESLKINLYYSMIVDSTQFVDCTLNLDPRTKLSYPDELIRLEELGIPYDYYYYMNNTRLSHCNIEGTYSNLIIKNCDMYKVTLSKNVFISGSGKIVLWNCVNNTYIRCEELTMINCINNGTIDCKDLTWQNSQNNGNVTFENAVDLDGRKLLNI